MPYFYFKQNSSGGSFDIDNSVTIRVWIEADTAEQANNKAEKIGIYFDGVNNDMDCSCCGDRWSPALTSEAEPFPILSSSTGWVEDGQYHTIIYHADGTVSRILKEVADIMREEG